MPTLQQLRYLIAVADTLSFSRAAELVHVTQPTLSMQIKELETRLGARLVERTRARVIITPAGAAIARKARNILSEIEDIREIARQDDPDAVQGTLQMGVVHSVGAYVLSLAMPDLRQSFPGMRIYVREDRIENLQRQLADGVHDVLLLPERLDRQEFESVLLIREPLHVVLPFDHRLADKDSIDPTDLAGETVLTMERGQSLHDQVVNLCRQMGAVHASDYEGTTLDTLRQMVATGMGISLLPALYVRSEVMREQLVVARPLTSDMPTRDVSMVWRRNAPRRNTYATLADIISARLARWGA